MATADELLKTAIRQGDLMADQIGDLRLTAAIRLHAIRAAAILIDRGKIGAAREVLGKAMGLEGESWD